MARSKNDFVYSVPSTAAYFILASPKNDLAVVNASATKNASTNIVGQGSDDVSIAGLGTSKAWVTFSFTGTIPELTADTAYYMVLYADCSVSTSNYLHATISVDATSGTVGYKINNSLTWAEIGGNFDIVCTINGYQLYTESVTCSDSYRGSLSAGSNYEYYLADDSGAIYEQGLNYKGDAGSAIICSWVSKNTDFTDQGAQSDIFKTVYSVKLFYLDNDASVQTTIYMSTDDGTTWVSSPIGTRSLGTGSGQVKTETWYFPGGKTGQFFKFKIESAGTTTRPQWLGLELDYIERGEHFNIA